MKILATDTKTRFLFFLSILSILIAIAFLTVPSYRTFTAPASSIGLYPIGWGKEKSSDNNLITFLYRSELITPLPGREIRIHTGALELKNWGLDWSIEIEDGDIVSLPAKLPDTPFRLLCRVKYDGLLLAEKRNELQRNTPTAREYKNNYLSPRQQEACRPELLQVPASGISIRYRQPHPTFLARLFGSKIPRRIQNSSNIPTNIVLLLIDTLRSDHTPPYGHPFVIAPHIDMLASLGVLFTQSYGASSSTRPSVGSMFTGLQPKAHGAIRHVTQGSVLYAGVSLLAERFQDAGFHTCGISSNAQVTARYGFDRGFHHYDCPVWDSQVTPKGLQQLERIDEPFFLFLHYMAPHAPYTPPREWRGLYDGLTAYPKQDNYCAEITTDDRRIGQIAKELSRQGLADRTAIWLVSDHGEELWEHGWTGHGAKLYEESVRTVSIASYLPLFQVGKRIGTPVTHADIFPTLGELFSWNRNPDSHGVSLLSILQDPSTSIIPDRPLFLHHAGGIGYFDRDKDAVVMQNKKLIWWPNLERWELYDLKTDPVEKNDLIDSERDTRIKLEPLLKQHLQQCKKIAGELSFPEPLSLPELSTREIENLKANQYLK